MFEKVNPSHPDKVADRIAGRTGHQVTASCSIGDETVNGIPYKDIVEQARLYIHTLGGFEKFALWGLIRPKDE